MPQSADFSEHVYLRSTLGKAQLCKQHITAGHGVRYIELTEKQNSEKRSGAVLRFLHEFLCLHAKLWTGICGYQRHLVLATHTSIWKAGTRMHRTTYNTLL